MVLYYKVPVYLSGVAAQRTRAELQKYMVENWSLMAKEFDSLFQDVLEKNERELERLKADKNVNAPAKELVLERHIEKIRSVLSERRVRKLKLLIADD